MDDIFHRFKTKSNTTRLQQADRELARLRGDKRDLETKYERLKIVTMAVWELVKRTQGLSDEALQAVISEIDARDGRRDGQVETKEQLADCHKCGKVVLVSTPTCPYCEAENRSYNPLLAL